MISTLVAASSSRAMPQEVAVAATGESAAFVAERDHLVNEIHEGLRELVAGMRALHASLEAFGTSGTELQQLQAVWSVFYDSVAQPVLGLHAGRH
eukprot:jgi/Chlat1/1403/Chrsp12S01971